MNKENVKHTIAEIEQSLERLKRELADEQGDHPKANTEAAQEAHEGALAAFNTDHCVSLNGAPPGTEAEDLLKKKYKE